MKQQIRYACVATVLSLLGACSTVPERPAAMQALPECCLLPNCVNTQSGRGIHNSEPTFAGNQLAFNRSSSSAMLWISA